SGPLQNKNRNRTAPTLEQPGNRSSAKPVAQASSLPVRRLPADLRHQQTRRQPSIPRPPREPPAKTENHNPPTGEKPMRNATLPLELETLTPEQIEALHLRFDQTSLPKIQSDLLDQHNIQISINKLFRYKQRL